MTSNERKKYYEFLARCRIIPDLDKFKATAQALQQIRSPIQIHAYLLLKRSFIACNLLLIGFAYLYSGWLKLQLHLQPLYIYLFCVLLFTILCFDQLWLGLLAKHRAQKMTKEIFIVSRQLLYFSDSMMNLHGKLVRCIPFTQTIKNEMYMLTNEWYEGPRQAIERFKHRLGTNEAYSFAETLAALQQFEHENYYKLLKERIEYYKAQIDLEKENKKESASYILFILAGIPILYTFRVFIFPWILEGQKVFNSLN